MLSEPSGRNAEGNATIGSWSCCTLCAGAADEAFPAWMPKVAEIEPPAVHFRTVLACLAVGRNKGREYDEYDGAYSFGETFKGRWSPRSE